MNFQYGNFNFDLWESKYANDLVFIAVSGAHSYGWARDDSDLDVRLVWMPDLMQALSVVHRGKTKQSQKDNIDCTTYPIHHFLRLLVKGNGNCLENLFQEKLYENEKLVGELQKLTLENLHVGFLKHYLGYSNGLIKDMNNSSRLQRYGETKLILANYRVLQAGLILAKRKEVVYKLQQQYFYVSTDYCIPLLGAYLHDTPPNRELLDDAREEIQRLQGELEEEIEQSLWFKVFPSIIYDRWLVQYYRTGLEAKTK